jgi:mycothiol synthase
MIAVRTAETDAVLEAWRPIRLAVVPDERVPTVAELRAEQTGVGLLLVAERGGDVAGAGVAERSSHAGFLFVAPRAEVERALVAYGE